MTITATQVGDAYLAILDVLPPGGLTGAYDTTVAAQINGGSITLGNFESSLINSDPAQYTSEPALVTYDAFYGATPSLSLLTTIATATNGINYLTDNTFYYAGQVLHNAGYTDANIWTIQGADWASDTASTFYTLYNGLATGTTQAYTTFIDEAYVRAFGSAPTAAETNALLADIPAFAQLLAGHTPATALQIMGGLFGYMLYEAQIANSGPYATAATAFLTTVANDAVNNVSATALYGPELLTETAVVVNLGASTHTATENTSITFTVSTQNVANGTVVPYTLTGVTASEVVGGQLTGTVTINNNTGTFTVATSPLPGEGLSGNLAAALTLPAGATTTTGSTQTIALTETATTYTLTDTAPGTTTEGSTVVFHLANNGLVPAGEVLNYTLTGVTASQVVGGQLTGTVTVTSDGTVNIPVTLNSVPGEGLGGNLTVTVSLPPSANAGSVATASVPLSETGTSFTVPSTGSVTEGGSINVAMHTNLPVGTTETYTLSSTVPNGLSQIPVADRSGTVTFDSSGNAVVTIHTSATVFNTTTPDTFVLTLNTGAVTPPTDTITINESAIIAIADSAGGTTNQVTLGHTIVEQTTGGVISDGTSVTFTIAVSGVSGAAVAGMQEAWSLNDLNGLGVSTGALSQVVGPTSGTVTLDANGDATITIMTSYSGTGAFSGQGDLTIDLTGGLQVADTVVLNAPALLYFTTAPNEVLIGGQEGTTFSGVVDSIIVGNNTMSNGESAQGAAGFSNSLDLIVNAANTDVLPGSAANPDINIQTLNVTDLNSIDPVGVGVGTYFNLQYMPQLMDINTTASDVAWDDFFNVQNVVNVGVINNDYSSGATVEVDVVDTATPGPVTLTLDNSGSFELIYQTTSGNDLVTAWTIQNTGDNGIDLVGASTATSITVNGTGSLWMNFNGDNNLYDLTLVDARGLTGPYTDNYQFGFDPANIYNTFTFWGPLAGNTFVDVHQEDDYTTTTINTGSGNDHIHVNSYEGYDQTITVNSGDGNTSSDTTGSHNGGDSIDLHGWRATYQTLNVTSGNGNNTTNIVSADYADVNVNQGNGDNDVRIDLWNGQEYGTAAAMVAVTVGNGTNDIHIDTARDGHDGDVGSSVGVTVGTGADNDIHIREGYNSTTNVTVGNGNGTSVHVDNYGGDYADDAVLAVANITVGSGSDVVVGYHDHGIGWDDVTINLGATVLGGDTGASGTVWAHVGEDSTLTENLGSGAYTLHDHVDGSYSTLTVTALDVAGGGDVIYAGLHGAYFDDASITMGGGNNEISVWQDSSGTSVSNYATIAITTQDAAGAVNDIFVDLDGSYDSLAVTVGAGNNDITVTDGPNTGDYVNIQAGGGTNDIGVDLSGVTASTVIIDAGSAHSTGADTVAVELGGDAASSANIDIQGSGNDSVSVTGTTGGAAVTVEMGSGNNWIGVDSTTLPTDITLIGGVGGYNTLALPGDVTALNTVALVNATIEDFSALELTSAMTHNVDLLDLGPHNSINQVILDGGFLGGGPGLTISGLVNNAEVDFLWGASTGTLSLPIGNAGPNPNDVVNLLFDSQDTADNLHVYGAVNVDPAASGAIHTLNVESTGVYGQDDFSLPTIVTNAVEIRDSGITTLNILGTSTAADLFPDAATTSIVNGATFHETFGVPVVADGDIYLNLDNSDAGNGANIIVGALDFAAGLYFMPGQVNADGFYAGISDTDAFQGQGFLGGIFGPIGGAITFNAEHTTYDQLTFGNAGGDTVSLGNYDNTVIMGNGAGDSLTMAHTVNVYGSSDGLDTVTMGNGAGDIVTLDNNGSNADTVTVGTGAGDAVSIGTSNDGYASNGDNNDTVTLGANSAGHYAGGGDSVTIGNGYGSVADDVVNINGGDTTGVGSTAVETVTFYGASGGGNTVNASYASGTTINLNGVVGANPAGAHTTADTIVFTHVTDSSYGYNDTVTGFNGAAGGDTINLTAVIAQDGDTLAHGIQQANGALAVLGVLNTDALATHQDAVIYDYADGILYDFHSGAGAGVNSTNFDFANTLSVQLVGMHLGTGEAAHFVIT